VWCGCLFARGVEGGVYVWYFCLVRCKKMFLSVVVCMFMLLSWLCLVRDCSSRVGVLVDIISLFLFGVCAGVVVLGLRVECLG